MTRFITWLIMIGQQNSYLHWSRGGTTSHQKSPVLYGTTDTPTTLRRRPLEYIPLSECIRPRWLRWADLGRLRFRDGERVGTESITWSGAKNSGTSSLALRGQIAISNHSIWKARKRSNSKRSTSIELRWGAGNLEVSRISRDERRHYKDITWLTDLEQKYFFRVWGVQLTDLSRQKGALQCRVV